MLLILGTAMLVAASVLLIVGHLALNRPSAPHTPNPFGAAELVAFTVTAFVTGGMSSLVGRLLTDWRPIIILETGGAVALVILGSIAAWRLLRKTGRVAAEASPLHAVGRRDRRGPGDRPQSAGGSKAIRAVR